MRRFVALALVCVGCGSLATPARGQARVDTGDRGWMSGVPTMQNLTVMIDAKESEGCRGAGFLVGVENSTVYGVTARHVVAEMGVPRVTGAAIGVRTVRHERVRSGGEPDERRRRLQAVVTQESEALDLAVFRLEDAALAREAKDGGPIAVAADLVPGDQVYAIGCAAEDATEWDTPLETVAIAANDRATGSLLFPEDYIRDGFSGGPLIHVLGLDSAVVGMAQAEGRARDIQQILDQLRRWKIPVLLSASGSQPGCQFEVRPKKVIVEPVVGRPSTVTLTGTPGCTWDSDTEHQSWFHITDGVIGRDGTGAASVGVSRGPRPDVPLFEPCDPERRQQMARVGGRLIDVSARCSPPPARRQ